jgi:Icc-related predicted phosphoesterase
VEEQAYRRTYEEEEEDKVCVISFSHFLPRQELCPEKRFLIEPSLTKVIGSTPLRRQVDELRPSLHIFGHTHIPIDLRVEGIR